MVAPLEILLSLFFPSECESCGVHLRAPAAPGLCGTCERAVHWLTPPFCRSCGRPCAAGPCAACRAARPAFDTAWACAAYAGPWRDLLRRYKFGRRRSLAGLFGRALIRFARERAAEGDRAGWDVVTAVPLDPVTERGRGFNQCAPLVARLARELGIPAFDGLRRQRGSSAQSLLGRRARFENVKGRFRVRSGRAVRGRRVLLVDDVITTGVTVSECARALKDAGASSVTVLACARVL